MQAKLLEVPVAKGAAMDHPDLQVHSLHSLRVEDILLIVRHQAGQHVLELHTADPYW